MRVLAICDAPPTLDPVQGDGATLIAARVLPLLPDSIELELAYFQDRPAGPDSAVATRAKRVTRLPVRSRAAGMASTPATLLPRATWQRRGPVAVETVRELSRGVDLVYLHGLHVFPYAFDVRRPVVVHEIDPWSSYWRRRSGEGSPHRRAYDRLQARRASRLERRVARRAAAYFVVNADDASALQLATGQPIETVPNGFDPAPWSPVADALREHPVVGFVGSLDYPPNVAAVTELAREVFPAVRAAVPEASLVLAGRRPGPAVHDLAALPGVEVVPDVPDLASICERIVVAAYPGNLGEGTKNTVREVMAAGCALVASPSALRGVPDGPHALVARTPEEMAEHAVALLRDPDARARQRRAGRDFVETLPSWGDVAARYAEVFDGVMRSASAQRAGR